MTIKDTARMAAHQVTDASSGRFLSSQVADAVAVATLREVRETAVETGKRMQGADGVFMVLAIDRLLAEFSAPEGRPTACPECGGLDGTHTKRSCQPSAPVTPVPPQHPFKHFGLDDPRYYADMCATCGDQHRPAIEARPTTEAQVGDGSILQERYDVCICADPRPLVPGATCRRCHKPVQIEE